jgi:lactoylglutathione lyase
MSGFTAIGHVALRVRDVERALEFYSDRLGFAEILRLHREDGRLWLIYLRITDDQFLEIFPDAVGERAPPPEANGLNHLCPTVDDLDRVAAQLGERGIPLTQRKKLGADGNFQAWIEDPDGNRIELMQMAESGLQAQAIRRLAAGAA